MQILLIRHGKAEDQGDFAKSGQPDDLRPLTAEGLEEMRSVGRALRPLVPHIDVLAESPLVRARQTADAIAAAFPDAARETTEALSPEAPFTAFRAWLGEHRDAAVVAAVGHNPHLSELAAWLTRADVDMKKGSALLLELDGVAREGSAKLLWYATPRQLLIR